MPTDTQTNSVLDGSTAIYDPGDEVQRRFRYQVNYACLKSMLLLTSDPAVAAVFCEHLEDVLLQLNSGKFVGIQIKTRELDQPAIKSSDEAIKNALAKFCRLDALFPGCFEHFVLATNFVFFEGEGFDNPRKVVAACQSGLEGIGPRHPIRKYLQTISKSEELPFDDVVAALARVALEERKTGIDQPDLELIHAMGSLPALGAHSFDKLSEGVKRLQGRVWAASSKSITDNVLSSHEVSPDFSKHVEKLIADQKRITREDVSALLADLGEADTSAALLTIAGYLNVDGAFPGLGRMEIKMAAGAISYESVAQMKDNVASLESAFLRWKERYGLSVANERLAHLQHLALRDARIESASCYTDQAPFGSAMLQRLSLRAKETWGEEKDGLFSCRHEHLLGAAGLLSEQCKVWWSPKTEVEVRDGDGS